LKFSFKKLEIQSHCVRSVEWAHLLISLILVSIKM
jgi:hypothetical protein